MTALTEKPTGVEGETARLRRRLRTMTTMVIVLAVALIGLGTWMVFDAVSGSDTAATSEIETLLDDYGAAWNDYDAEAFLALVTDDYVHEYAGSTSTAAETAATIETGSSYGTQVEPIGDPIVNGKGPAYFVAQADVLTSSETELSGISLFTIVEDGGVYRIQSHIFVGSLE